MMHEMLCPWKVPLRSLSRSRLAVKILGGQPEPRKKPIRVLDGWTWRRGVHM